MGRYWALVVAAFLMRGVGILSWMFSFFSLIALVVVDVQQMQNPTNDPVGQFVLGLSYFTLQFWALAGIFIGIGWFAAGQLISLFMDIETNTRRVAESANAAQRRRAKYTPRPELEDETSPAPTPPDFKRSITANMPPLPPERGYATAHITYNQDPKPRSPRPRLQSAEEPTSGDTYSYGRPGKRENE